MHKIIIIAIAVVGILVCSTAVWAQAKERTSSDLWRDVLLTVPPAAKAGFILSILAGSLAGTNQPSDEYPPPYNIIAYALVAGIATANTAVIVSSWSGLSTATLWSRRAAFGVDAAGVLFAAALLIADLVQPDPSGSAVLPLLGAMASFGVLMVADLLPFSTELRAGISFGL